MPKKKPAKSGYWQFFLECRDKQSAKGGKTMSNDELQVYASSKWKGMSKEARMPYDLKALTVREHFVGTFRPRTTDGIEVEVVERREKEAHMRDQEMKNDINKILKAAHFASNLDDEIFFIIHINHLAYYPTHAKYFICELAISATSLKNGVEDVFHQIVYPGELPKGYLGGAVNHSKTTHQLLDLVKDSNDNTHEVFQAMTQFLEKYTIKGTVPIVYAEDKILEMTRNVIENFCFDFNYKGEIKVYSLQYMFYSLRNVVAGKNVWTSEGLSFSALEKDAYCYSPNISCEFHEMADLTVYCSKSIVTRSAYTICDHCCADLRINLIPGQHVPQKSKVGGSHSSYTPSVCSNLSVSSSAFSRNQPRSQSSASSVVSFSSLKANHAPMKAAERLEKSFNFKPMTFKEVVKRDHDKTNFPERGTKGLTNNNKGFTETNSE